MFHWDGGGEAGPRCFIGEGGGETGPRCSICGGGEEACPRCAIVVDLKVQILHRSITSLNQWLEGKGEGGGSLCIWVSHIYIHLIDMP